MTKFETKAFECEILGDIYNSLDSRSKWYMQYDEESDEYKEPENKSDVERLAIVRAIMVKIEKMI